MDPSKEPKNVLITGAAGYIGRQLVDALGLEKDIGQVIAVDIASDPFSELPEKARYIQHDIRDAGLADITRQYNIDCVTHLASIVSPTQEMTREFLFDVEVNGTKNVVAACLDGGVKQLIVTSSGAAYGYYKDNPPFLDENDPIRGNDVFAYSAHKRLVEEYLAECRKTSPRLKQLIFRPGTVLGSSVRNQITALFEKSFVLGISGSSSPFVFIWDRDLVDCLLQGIKSGAEGIYNLAGDGTMTMKEIAEYLRKPYLPVPAVILAGALWLLSRFGLTRYGPEQIGFLRYRPVLANTRLKTEFGYTPQKTTQETFEVYLAGRGKSA